MIELSDKDIIAKIKNGEIDYYSLLVKKYTDTIYRFIKLKIRKDEDAEDLVQNVFISFYKAIERFDEAKPVRPYLYQIVGNELKMFYRSRKQVLQLKEEMVGETEEAMVFDESNLKVLSKMEKEILLLVYEGVSYEEISGQFKKPLNTIRSIIRRARLKVKRPYEKT